MEFGCCISWEQYALATSMGYDYIELSASEVSAFTKETFVQVVETIKNGHLPCRGFNDYCKDTPVMVGESFDPEAIRKYAKTVMARGHMLGIQTVGIGAPSIRRLPQGFPMETAKVQCKAFLTILQEEATPFDIQILFESVQKEMCNFVNTMAEAAEIAEELEADGVPIPLIADFYHMKKMKEETESIIPLLPFIRHTHISGLGEGMHRPFLTEADLPWLEEILDFLKKHHWEGSLSVECNGDDFSMGARESLRLLKEIDKHTQPDF